LYLEQEKQMPQLIECVPNFSEGRNSVVIEQIAEAIRRVEGVKLLNVDPGKATNRTVYTFVGEPGRVAEAAFCSIRKAAELIDMRNHHGEHPRFGATDVCPLVPVSGITMEETVSWAKSLAKRVGEELEIPVYCYEFAASHEERRSLASCRSGEYEGLREKLGMAGWKPDFGPSEWSDKIARTGAVAIGARNFLIAYNINLNTTSVRRANSVAFDIREAGRILREGDPVTGTIVTDNNGEPVRIPGSLKNVRAIGWFIKEYGIAQISMNLTGIRDTPLHVVFDEVCEKARLRGLRVTGSELIGLVPLEALLDAGRWFLRRQQRSTGIPDHEIIRIAVKSLGLDELGPFHPRERIIEYMLEDQRVEKLTGRTICDFADETASESPAPGGGSVAALAGALGASLGTMVANLSAHKRGWDDRWEEFSAWAEKGKFYYTNLLQCVDEDTEAFNRLMDAFGMPKNSGPEKTARKEAIQSATLHAMQVPLKVMQLACESMEVMKAMAQTGNPNSVSDAGVGALCANAAVRSAWLNVKINGPGLIDREKANEILNQAGIIAQKSGILEKDILGIVERAIRRE
jgi:glutamate formiminotransferase/formiminotetrahydrofolate cyclodeaminase